MAGYGRGCHFRVQSALAEYKESLVTQCVCMQTLLPTLRDSWHCAFQGGYSAMFTASRRVLKGARRVLCPSKQPDKNTVWGACMFNEEGTCDDETENRVGGEGRRWREGEDRKMKPGV